MAGDEALLPVLQAVAVLVALALAQRYPVLLAPQRPLSLAPAVILGSILALPPTTAIVSVILGVGLHALAAWRFPAPPASLVSWRSVVGRGLVPRLSLGTWARDPEAWKGCGLQAGAWLALGLVIGELLRLQPLALLLLVPPLVFVHETNARLQTNETLGQTLERHRRFVSDVSHELRTPLTSIQGNLDFLLTKAGGLALDAATEKALQSTAGETERLAQVVAELVAVAQMDEGEALRVEREDIESLSYDVYLEMRSRARGVKLRFVLDGLQQAGAMAAVDADKYRLLLRNLVDNAIRYTPAGGRVSVTVGADETGVRVEVQDTGIGIPPAALPRVFDRFYRGEEARKLVPTGSGLGLAIAQQIAKSHGGRLTASSPPGEGSTFTLWLPGS